MKDWIKAYVVEVGTFIVCGSICAGVLFSMYGNEVLTWTRRYMELNQTPRGAVLVYQVDSGTPMFGGDTMQAAVASQVERIRRVMGQPTGPDAKVLSWRESRSIRNSLPGEERQLCRSLSGIDLRDSDLRGLDLRGMNLSQGDFRGADLTGARLDGAVLSNANFENAKLSEIDFRDFSDWGFHLGHRVSGVEFHRSNFEGTFVGRGLQAADFRQANLRGATVYAFSTDHMDIRGADLRGANFSFTYGQEHGREATFDEALATLIYDETTQVEGLRLGAVMNTELPFLRWALARGALASFPQKDPISGRWVLRQWGTYEILCEGPTAAEAFQGHVATLRREIEAATGLRYPESAGWSDVVQAIQALPAERSGPLKALLKSTQDIDLQGIDLRGADLRGLDLEGAVLRGANLAGADLSDTTLDRAYIVDSDFRDVRMSRASLRGTIVRESNLEGSEWRDVNAQRIKLTAVPLSGSELVCVDFFGARFNEVSFAESELEEVMIRFALLEDTRFSHTVLRALDWRQSILQWIHFDGAFIADNDFSGVVLHELSFSESAFGTPSRWEKAILGPDQFGNLPGPPLIAKVESGGGRLETDSQVVSRIQGQRRHTLLNPPYPPFQRSTVD